jgi:hypothetical protein
MTVLGFLYDLALSSIPDTDHIPEELQPFASLIHDIEPTAVPLLIESIDRYYGIWVIRETGEKILACGLDEEGNLKLVRDYM